MVSALLMWRRLQSAVRYAMREEDFGPILTGGGLLIAIGIWMKLFTVLYILVGIGVLVEVVRRIGRGFLAVHQEHSGT
jgi:hypothetical protein